MSGVEVVAAVSAIVSAFHAGSELLKHIKAKRRKARAAQAQQEFEEKQLQDSLVSGEQQIGFRYIRDVREMGDVVRVGDIIAHQRLMHVAFMLQGEIIKSLQMAAQHETAILNLRLLHEASITTRKDTFVILDEMKQRIILTRPIPRQIEGTEQRSSTVTLPSSWPSNLRSMDVALEGYIPSAVTIPSPAESKENRSGLARYFQMKRSTSESSKAMSTSVNTQAEAPKIDYCAALEQMAQAKDQDRSALMNDIEEIRVSYKGLNVNDEATGQAWNNQQHPHTFPERRGTLNMLNGNGYQQADMFSSSWSATPMNQQNQPLPHPHMGQQPTFNQDVFNEHSQYLPYAGPTTLPHHQTHMSHRLPSSQILRITRGGSHYHSQKYGPQRPRPQSQVEEIPIITQCCHNASQRHFLTDLSRQLIDTPESIHSLLPSSWKSDMQFNTNGISGRFSGTWTCRPVDDNEPASFPLTIAGAPVVLPVDYRWPPTGGVSPLSDPRSSNPIDRYAEISVDIARDIFLTFEGCVGFYLLINALLQIIVPDEFDIAVAASCMPHTYGGLKICYINQTLKPTMFPTRTQNPQTKSSINVRSMPPLSINDTISAATVKPTKPKFNGKIGLRVLRDNHPYLVTSSHIITEAITARTMPMMPPSLKRLRESWKEQVEIVVGNVKIGTIEKSYDESSAQLYPQGFPHDITLIKPLDPSLVENIKSPVGGLTWLDRQSWSSLRRQSLHVKLLSPIETHRDAKTLRCCNDSEAVIVGEGIFLNVRGSKSLRDLNRSVWKRMVSRAVLYRLNPDFDPPEGNSGMALCADGTLENGTAVKGVIGFQSFVQRSDHFRNFEAEGDELEQRLKAGRIAFYGAFQLPDDLRDNYTIAC